MCEPIPRPKPQNSTGEARLGASSWPAGSVSPLTIPCNRKDRGEHFLCSCSLSHSPQGSEVSPDPLYFFLHLHPPAPVNHPPRCCSHWQSLAPVLPRHWGSRSGHRGDTPAVLGGNVAPVPPVPWGQPGGERAGWPVLSEISPWENEGRNLRSQDSCRALSAAVAGAPGGREGVGSAGTGLGSPRGSSRSTRTAWVPASLGCRVGAGMGPGHRGQPQPPPGGWGCWGDRAGCSMGQQKGEEPGPVGQWLVLWK